MNVNLLGLDANALAAFVAELGEKPFRAKQLLRWVHRAGESRFADMSDLARSLREKLTESAQVSVPPVISDSVSGDGTRKWLLDVGAGNAVETVFIPETNRGTLCISTQAGCTLACEFCSTGRQGFNRNLTTAEIVGQLWLARRALGTASTGERREKGADPFSSEPDGTQKHVAYRERVVSNVVLMGMGEPLLNFDNVVPALRLMLDDNAYGLSRRRLTLSTSGIVPLIDRLREECPVALAVSLHAPTDGLRDRLMPINRKYPLRELLAACRRYLERLPRDGSAAGAEGWQGLPDKHGYRPGAPRDFITFEYVLLAGVNDSEQQANELITLLAEVPSKINLIPFNPFPGAEFQRSPREAVRRFSDVLNSAGIVTTTRKTRGDDIDAACGQLAGQVRDRTRRIIRMEAA